MQTKTPSIQLAANNPNAEDLAAEAVARWRQLDGALLPIIGRRGIAAIYTRALEITSGNYPWLALTDKYRSTSDNFASLQQTLARQSARRAAAGNLALYQCFRELLASLIGQSLTARLLQAIANDPAGHFFQSTPPRLRVVGSCPGGG